MTAAPFIKWCGGKRHLLPRLLPLAPARIDVYFEPFLGGGALFFALASAGRIGAARLSDVNLELVRTYRAIRDDAAGVLAALDAHVHSSEHYCEVRSRDWRSMSDAQCAARMIFLNKTGFNGLYRVNRSGGFNVPFGDQPTMTAFMDPGRLMACSAALACARIDWLPFDHATEHASAGNFVYFDPPYVPVSKTSNFTSYSAGGFGPADQQRLANEFTRLAGGGVPVVLSNSECAAVRGLYAAHHIEAASRPGTMSETASKRGRVGEVVVSANVAGLAGESTATGTVGQGPLLGGER